MLLYIVRFFFLCVYGQKESGKSDKKVLCWNFLPAVGHIDNLPQPLTRQSSIDSYLSAVEEENDTHRSSEDSNASSSSNEGYDEWIGCCVSGLDVTWPYLTHSDASRATCTHHCYACGRIVCTYCAPAGDVVQGEGVNKTVTLPDLRLALPMRGIFQPQRVCLHCYFDSSYPGLGKSNV